jgi:hypothetical protein
VLGKFLRRQEAVNPLRPWMIANGIHVWSSSPRTDVLGHSQPSLRD